jgi:hypothetical protein
VRLSGDRFRFSGHSAAQNHLTKSENMRPGVDLTILLGGHERSIYCVPIGVYSQIGGRPLLVVGELDRDESDVAQVQLTWEANHRKLTQPWLCRINSFLSSPLALVLSRD